MEDNPYWGEPTPTDVWEDMQKLDHLYEELLWDHRDKLEFAIEGNHITIRNKSREGRKMHSDLDALDKFLDSKDEEEVQQGSLSIRVPMEDMTVILTQLWKSRGTEPKIGELYEKYKALIPKE